MDDIIITPKRLIDIVSIVNRIKVVHEDIWDRKTCIWKFY